MSGYGITDTYTSSTIDSKLSGYLPLTGGTISGILTIKANGYPFIEFKAGSTTYGYYGFSETGVAAIWNTKDWHTLIHSGNYNSYTPTLTGTGASGTWGINISGNAATATIATNANNSDTLDGLHASSFARMQYDNNLIYHGNEFNFTPTAYKGEVYINYRTMGGLNGAITGYIFADGAGNTLAIITNGNFSGNSASATKLQTPRTIWGQSFDGSSDVSGDLNLGASKLYWNQDSANYYMSCSGTQMIYNMYGGHIFSTVGGAERMRICDNGDVGIGTTNPLFALDIYRENKGDLLRLTSNTTYVCAIYKPSSGTGWSVGANDNNQFYWWNSQKEGIVTYIDNVGNLTTTGGGAFGGNVTATGFYQSSDERLKTFYDPIKVDLDKLSKLRKNYFKFNNKNELEIGVSAQEIQSIYPEIVSENSDGYLSVAYDKLSVIALAAIDEQQTIINEQNNKINQLEERLKAIENILSKLTS